ncbi:MAG: LysE family transporter [Rhodocyclaceae bacterium]
MEWKIWLVYALAVMGLSLTPGPNSLLALTHGALYGRRRTLWTITGGAVGFTCLIAFTMLGIGALLQASAHALTVMKWIGGAYLVWLGIQLWRAPALQLDLAEYASPQSAAPRLTVFRQGFLTAASNPKVLLFYGAFLPQFITPTRSLLVQFVVMAATFALAEACVEFGIATLAHSIRPWLKRSGRTFNRLCGALFSLIGSALPFAR